MIDGVEHGTGWGRNKKEAEQHSARETLALVKAEWDAATTTAPSPEAAPQTSPRPSHPRSRVGRAAAGGIGAGMEQDLNAKVEDYRRRIKAQAEVTRQLEDLVRGLETRPAGPGGGARDRGHRSAAPTPTSSGARTT